MKISLAKSHSKKARNDFELNSEEKYKKKGLITMAKRERTNSVQFYLSEEEQIIFDEKFKLSGMKSKSAYLRKRICI